MARIRSVHPDICASQTLAALDAGLERTFVRLWTHCDDEGRCEDRPRLIKAGIYPEHDDMTWERVDQDLWGLEQAGLIIRYETAGKRYIAVRSWTEYQHPQKPRGSKHPEPPLQDTPPEPQDTSDTPTRLVREPSRTGKGLELGVGEGVGEGVGVVTRAADPSTALALVPANGSSPTAKGTKGYPPDFEHWWELYPRKVAKAEAARAWGKAVRIVDPATLAAALASSVRAWQAQQRDLDKLPHAATWLNGRRWEDPPDADIPRPPEPAGFNGIRAALNSLGAP